jgi:hypothetical protein
MLKIVFDVSTIDVAVGIDYLGISLQVSVKPGAEDDLSILQFDHSLAL